MTRVSVNNSTYKGVNNKRSAYLATRVSNWPEHVDPKSLPGCNNKGGS